MHFFQLVPTLKLTNLNLTETLHFRNDTANLFILETGKFQDL